MSESLEEKIKRVIAETVEVVEYDQAWPRLFEEEKSHLLRDLPSDLIVRIEHFGSTAVQNLMAKPIVDMVIEVSDVQRAKTVVPEILEPQGYDCFWRPTLGDDGPPWHTWCIRRDAIGRRTHHLHFVAIGGKEDELRFCNILRKHPDVANRYSELKRRLCRDFETDRVAYTKAKGEFIHQVLKQYPEKQCSL